jgi:predicted house-cleaning NTP pyrophosphatase (Maf/HAM1 superfamily)
MDESRLMDEDIVSYVARLAKEKSFLGLTKKKKNQSLGSPNSFLKRVKKRKIPWKMILGADTIVAVRHDTAGGYDILPKEKSKEGAFRNLKALSNRSHLVLTSVNILYPEVNLSEYQTDYLLNLGEQFSETFRRGAGEFQYIPINIEYLEFEKDKYLEVNLIESSEVEFENLSDTQIYRYLEEFKPFDKAGSYGIQDNFPLVKKLHGSRSNVIGFPLGKLLAFLMI